MDLPINYTKATWQEKREARNQYVILQNSRCWLSAWRMESFQLPRHSRKFCGCSLSDKPSKKVQEVYLNMSLFPKGFLDYPVHLHHDHKTHMTIGAVHSKCNGYLWQYLGE